MQDYAPPLPRRLFALTPFLGAFFLFTFFAIELSSQNNSPCSSWGIEICATPLPPDLVGNSCVNSNNSCTLVFFYVYLVRSGSQGNVNTEYDFSFTQFNVSGSLNITPNSGAPSISFSVLDKAQSLMCSPSNINNPNDPNAPTFSIEPSNNTFSFQAINTGNPINWMVYGRKLLFVIAVDNFPGEAVTLSPVTAHFVLANGTTCNPVTVDGCGSSGIPTFSAQIPSPCTATGLKLKIGNAVPDPATGYPNRKSVPVFISAPTTTTYSLAALDFLMHISAAATSSNVTLKTGLISQTVLHNNLNGGTQNATDLSLYAQAQNLTVTASPSPTASNTLFTIVLDGPTLASDCFTTTLSFTDYRRILDLSNNVCCQPQIQNNNVDVSWGPAPCLGHCSGLSVKAEPVVPAPTNNCNKLVFDVNMTSKSTATYDYARITLEVKYSGFLNWLALYSSSVYCSNIAFNASATPIGTGLLYLTFTSDQGYPISLYQMTTTGLVRFGFDAHDACIESVTIKDVVFTQNGVDCLPAQVTSAILAGNSADDICQDVLNLEYDLWWHWGVSSASGLSNVDYCASDGGPGTCPSGTCSVTNLYNTGIKHASICACSLLGVTQYLKPSKTDNPLNGVSTYDLVLISKHILGIQLLSSPFDYIAADANSNGNITVFDIVELRKLILGIYTTLPNAPSYRFVDKLITLPNNQFPTGFHEYASFTLQANPASTPTVSFNAIKIGDINQSVILTDPFSNPQDRSIPSIKRLGYSVPPGKKGDQIEIPVFALESSEEVGWQLGLKFDPSKIALKSVIWASPNDSGHNQDWFEPVKGQLRLLGFETTGLPKQLSHGALLFTLKAELLDDSGDVNLESDENSIPSEIYDRDGLVSTLGMERSRLPEDIHLPNATLRQDGPVLLASIYPNPVNQFFKIEITVPESCDVSIRLVDMYGQNKGIWNGSLTAGSNTILSNQLPALEPGQYFIRISTPWGDKVIRLIKAQ